MKRFLAPAGVRLTARQLVGTFTDLCADAHQTDPSLSSFGADLGVKHVFGLCSARAALYIALKMLHQIEPERTVVAMPCYTCFSVAAAVVRAGLTIYPLEMIPQTLDFDYQEIEQLPPERLLCVITANLFGIANDVSRISSIARQKGAFVIDDASQSFGATRDGKVSGTAADLGILSLGRGKPLPAGEGGLILTDSSKLAEALRGEIEELATYSSALELEVCLKVVLGSLFLSPNAYWLPNSMKFLKLGVTEFNPDFPVRRVSRVAHALFSQLLRSLSGLNQSRSTKARELTAAVRQIPGFSILRAPAGCEPNYFRLPLLSSGREARDQAVKRLWQSGIGATSFYPSAICGIEDISRHMAVPDFHRPGAEEISRRLLTLPTHSFVQSADVKRIADLLRRGVDNQSEASTSALSATAVP